MDTIQHAYTPALAVLVGGGSPIEASVAGVIGASPDILGAYGTIIKKDEYRLYNLVHSMPFIVTAFLLGVAAIPFYWPIGVGLLGYAIHLILDMSTHIKRWWIPNERLWMNDLAWIILGIVSFFVNPWLGVSALFVGTLISTIARIKHEYAV